MLISTSEPVINHIVLLHRITVRWRTGITLLSRMLPYVVVERLSSIARRTETTREPGKISSEVWNSWQPRDTHQRILTISFQLGATQAQLHMPVRRLTLRLPRGLIHVLRITRDPMSTQIKFQLKVLVAIKEISLLS